MKVGLTVTTHRSNHIRPNGVQLLNNFLNSFRTCGFEYDYCFYISDNQSEIPFEYPSNLNIKTFYIENQSINGLTGAWNLSLYEAYKDNCDIFWNFNDDIRFTKYTNKFIECILNYENRDNAIFGPLTDNGGHKIINQSDRVGIGYSKLKTIPNIYNYDVLNGFSFGFTKSVYETYGYTNSEFFPINHTLNKGDGRWGGQEGYFAIKAGDGLEQILVNECWLQHTKLKSYVTARNLYGKK
jgi:GT2 family glycosyltransferase